MHLEQSEQADDAQIELKLVQRLVRLSKTSWSPTLRANADFIESLQQEIRAAETYRRKLK
jgi:hypothetical protein